MALIIGDVGAVFRYKKSGKFASAAFVGKPCDWVTEPGV
jgi:hypothetical protein